MQPHLANMDVLKEEESAHVKQLNNLKAHFDKTSDEFQAANLQRLETNCTQDQMQSICWTDYLYHIHVLEFFAIVRGRFSVNF